MIEKESLKDAAKL